MGQRLERVFYPLDMNQLDVFVQRSNIDLIKRFAQQIRAALVTIQVDNTILQPEGVPKRTEVKVLEKGSNSSANGQPVESRTLGERDLEKYKMHGQTRSRNFELVRLPFYHNWDADRSLSSSCDSW